MTLTQPKGHTSNQIKKLSGGCTLFNEQDGIPGQQATKADVALLIAELLSTAQGKGASQIGVQDLAANFTGEDLETILAELASGGGGGLEHRAKDNVRVAEGTNINIASPGATLGGVIMSAGDRVLLFAQATLSQNGLWVWNGAAVPMTRPTDFPTGSGFDVGHSRIVVDEGGYGNTGFILSDDNPVDVDTDDQNWSAYPVLPPPDPLALSSIVVEVLTVPLTTLAAAPVELVPAPGPGFYLEFVDARIWLNFLTTAMDDAIAAGNLVIATPSYNWAVVEADGLIDAVAPVTSICKPDGSGTQNRIAANEAINLTNDGGEFGNGGGGDSTLFVEVFYRVRALTV